MTEDQKKTRRQYNAEFKRDAAKLVVVQGMKRSKVAQDLGVSPYLIGTWVKEYLSSGENAFPGHGRLSPQDQRVRDLEEEVKQLRMERDILKKATAFFANHGR